MKIVLAPDSFKGSSESKEIISFLEKAAYDVFDNCNIVECPIADGGEGTLEAILSSVQGSIIKCTVKNPIGRDIPSYYAMVKDTAIIEMSLSSGLTLISENDRNPLNTTSYGTGQLIRDALEKGFKKITIAIGGSATNDGGAGAMQALGAKFFDNEDNELENITGACLSKIASFDLNGFDKRIKDCDISVMCDVTNPLLGKHGSTYVYGPQKGGDTNTLHTLENGMINYKSIVNNAYEDFKLDKTPGAGAAGGMGYALMAFCHAKLVSGITSILDIIEFEEKIKNADLIITGEGRVDYQSAFGKVIYGVSKYASKYDTPVIVIAGSTGEGFSVIYKLGVKSVLSIPNEPMTLKYCMENNAELVYDTAFNALSLIKIGMSIE